MSPDMQTITAKSTSDYSQFSGQDLKTLVEVGLNWLKINQQTVNALNVFPVPDGDTGTNMVLTMQAAVQEVSTLDDLNIGKIAHAVAQGALMGARGNSGVILSQLWRGFARTLDTNETMGPSHFVQALIEAKNTAYKGVVRPVEGTILTVAKDIASAAETALIEGPNLLQLLEVIVNAANESVIRTPELLPVLKQAGVVDSGGKGLFFIYEGMLRYIKGLPIETPLSTVQPIAALKIDGAMESIEPGQDFEVVVDFHPDQPLDLENFYRDLSEMGTSIQVGEGDGMYRMHIHVPTENKYLPIDYTMKLGTVTKINIENLQAQIREIDRNSKDKLNLTAIEPGQIAVIAVSPGFGISRIFASLGVAAIVEGGQSMNPSTQEILGAFENLPSNKVIVLPNNKNVILAAESTLSITVKDVTIIPSKSVPQGLSALLRWNPDGNYNDVVNEMISALNDVDTGEITIATRSVEINGVKVNQGQVIALLNGVLVSANESIEEACLSLLKNANTNEKERITLFYGMDISRNDVNMIVDAIRSNYPNHEIELHEGGQPHYQFIIAIE